MPSPEEVQLLKQARLLKEIVDTPGWREYESILRAQIATREAIVLSPLHALPANSVPQETDLASKAAAMEMFKGAIIGLRLALETPKATIESASDIAQESRKGDK